jgi:hypothetical protein
MDVNRCFVRGAEVARYLTSGRAYVQDERYAAGAGMRRSGQAHPCVDTRRPASYGPEVRYRTSSALCVNYKVVVSKRTNTLMAEAGADIVLPGPYEAGSRG